jgi:hypothetical protein
VVMVGDRSDGDGGVRWRWLATNGMRWVRIEAVVTNEWIVVGVCGGGWRRMVAIANRHEIECPNCSGSGKCIGMGI